ncbi:uncharacterized protein LOC132751997 [Ruditapes philippinarum]|uniref:uncharacterized protein LOC132751997 n=1 Tax=Ruditapes philippinarum TaxID=129788 RepID=UPI00295AB1C9|nr:uncharacterized protein LOC132751997 [Ruditapes philippinarum]
MASASGHVQPGTSIEALTKLQVEHKVGSLKETILKKSREEWRNTKIVFVHSCREKKVPDKLIDCLLRILRKTDPRTAMPKYSAYVFVVLTKYDLVKDENSFKWSSNEPTVTYEEFREIEKEIEQRFSIQGSLEDNRTRWVSYSDATGKDNPYIDNIALKFIKRMLMVRKDEVKSVKTVMSTWTLMILNMKKYWQNAKRILNEPQFSF